MPHPVYQNNWDENYHVGVVAILINKEIKHLIDRKIYDTYVLPVATYGPETTALTQTYANKLRVLQRTMERVMLGVSLRDKMRKYSKE